MGEELDFTLDDVPCETEGSISVEVPDPAVSHPAEEFDYEIQGVRLAFIRVLYLSPTSLL